MQLLDHAAPHQMGRQLPQGPHGEREPKVVRPRARDLQHHTDVFRPILRRSARRLARAQRLEPASGEQPNQLPHILLVEMQPLGNMPARIPCPVWRLTPTAALAADRVHPSCNTRCASSWRVAGVVFALR